MTHKVWFDVTIGGEAAGRIEVGLFGKTVPKVSRDRGGFEQRILTAGRWNKIRALCNLFPLLDCGELCRAGEEAGGRGLQGQQVPQGHQGLHAPGGDIRIDGEERRQL